MKKYMITAACNPYNARTHYTPIKWVMEDAYGDGLTLEQAQDILENSCGRSTISLGMITVHGEDAEEAVTKLYKLIKYRELTWEK